MDILIFCYKFASPVLHKVFSSLSIQEIDGTTAFKRFSVVKLLPFSPFNTFTVPLPPLYHMASMGLKNINEYNIVTTMS